MEGIAAHQAAEGKEASRETEDHGPRNRYIYRRKREGRYYHADHAISAQRQDGDGELRLHQVTATADSIYHLINISN